MKIRTLIVYVATDDQCTDESVLEEIQHVISDAGFEANICSTAVVDFSTQITQYPDPTPPANDAPEAEQLAFIEVEDKWYDKAKAEINARIGFNQRINNAKGKKI